MDNIACPTPALAGATTSFLRALGRAQVTSCASTCVRGALNRAATPIPATMELTMMSVPPPTATAFTALTLEAENSMPNTNSRNTTPKCASVSTWHTHTAPQRRAVAKAHLQTVWGAILRKLGLAKSIDQTACDPCSCRHRRIPGQLSCRRGVGQHTQPQQTCSAPDKHPRNLRPCLLRQLPLQQLPCLSPGLALQFKLELAVVLDES
jgi:hypothetical protein